MQPESVKCLFPPPPPSSWPWLGGGVSWQPRSRDYSKLVQQCQRVCAFAINAKHGVFVFTSQRTVFAGWAVNEDCILATISAVTHACRAVTVLYRVAHLPPSPSTGLVVVMAATLSDPLLNLASTDS